jgi:hypothetical protein
MVISEYVRKRMREEKRMGRTLHDISKMTRIEEQLVRRVWGGGPVGEKTLLRWAGGLGFADERELRGAAGEWWRLQGESLVTLAHPMNDPIEARRDANAETRTYGVNTTDVLNALETNPNCEHRDYIFWRDAFLASQDSRLRSDAAERIDRAPIKKQQAVVRKAQREREKRSPKRE